LGVIGAAAQSLWVEAILPAIIAVGDAIVLFLSAVAEAMADTVFGIPIALAILAGVAGIVGALVAMKAIKLASGGVVRQPTFAMLGEAGPEAVIPLGAGNPFGGDDRPIITKVYLDGRQIARASTKHQMAAWRWEGAGA
jgi:hypothetical protein